MTATSPDSAPSPPVPPVSPVTYTPYLTTTSSDSAPSPPAPPVTYTPYLTTTSPDSAPSPNLEQSAPPPRQRTPLPSYPGPLPTADPPRRRWVAFSVASSILMVIVITIVVAVNQFGGGDATKGETGEPLVLAYTQQLSADDTSAVAAAEGKAILAEVVDGSTVVSAVTPEGETLWTQTYELEPNELYLTVVEDLLIIDAYDLVTDDDEDIRAVAALDDGALLWQKPWTLNEHNDVAYYGTDVVFERRDGFEDNAVARVDLATGEEVWSKPGPDDVFILDEPRVRAETVWGVEEGTGAIPPDFYSLYDNLAAGDRIVDLDPHEGTAVVRDAATGDGITDGELPIDDEAWTVYDDLVVARASDEASPDRDTLVAHALSDLGKAWEVPLDPGFGIEHVKPCGPDLVCAALGDSSADDQHKTVAFDTETGDQVWELPVDWYLHDQWYTGPSGLVFGDQVFDTVDSFQNLDFEGDVIVEGQRFSSAMAVRDNRVVIEDRDSGGRNISILDLGTDGRSAPAGTGGHAPRHVSLLGELMVVLTGDWKAQVYIVPDIT
ncbi:PQQ-binding-like beta-propeller repeat protein [Glycomyces harbinensis]|uniref:outer membrane protein assembly factor BamB family protein n=1 Tax=Glycomyces harbinensis TaxID=58114 RepID=UPI001FE0F14A|nr:PQQ-binding-like beta-propeller repeat protein [Glycomyces harbinensis]